MFNLVGLLEAALVFYSIRQKVWPIYQSLIVKVNITEQTRLFSKRQRRRRMQWY